jgi:hypothetical protein
VLEKQRMPVSKVLLNGPHGHWRREGAMVELMKPLVDEVFDVPVQQLERPMAHGKM